MNKKLETLWNGKQSVVVDLKRKYSDQGSMDSAGTTQVVFPLEFSSVSSKSKLQKRRRLDASGEYAFPSGRQLLKHYSNLKKTGILKRLLYYQNDEWTDFSESVVALVNNNLVQKPIVEVQVDGSSFLLDFLHMMQLDLDTGLQQPIAWIDDSGNCFFPVNNLEEQILVTKHGEGSDLMEADPLGGIDVNLHLEIQVRGFDNECSGESDTIGEPVKAYGNVALRNCDDEIYDKGPDESSINDDKKYSLNRKMEENLSLQVTSVNRSFDSDLVRQMLFKATEPAIAEIVAVRQCKSVILDARSELFEKQLEITQKYRGNANVRFAWFPCPEGTVPSILKFGIGHCNQYKVNPFHGDGLYLIPANGTQFSINDIDVDENGARHVVLCRVIMGNMEVVHSGSQKFHPSSENIDSGVDDLQNPTFYLFGSANMNSHIYPDCVVSFNVTSEAEGRALVKEPRVGVSMSTPGCEMLPAQRRIPKSPWVPFPALFASISSRISPQNMELVRTYYELFKSKMMPRDVFIAKLRLIVGDDLLKSAIIGLKRKMSEPSASVVETS